MKRQISALTGDPANLWMSESLSPEIQERFLENVLAWEDIKEQPLFDMLERGGLQLPAPSELGDAQLTDKLWEVINAMAGLAHYLQRTDHLSDRELYERLWNEILREPTPVISGTRWACHIDILGGCSKEDLQLNLKYYADEEERRDWAEQFPEDNIPSHEPLPFDRDRLLP
jgi:hypothetical protein